MRPLYEYVNPREVKVIVPEYDLKSAPLSVGDSKLESIMSELANGVAKENILKMVDDWFKDNPKRRNIVCSSMIEMVLYIEKNDNKLLEAVLAELSRIGVNGEWISGCDKESGLGGAVRVGTTKLKLTTGTAKQFREDNYNYTVSPSMIGVYFKDSQYGNGYNNLPAEDMTVLRRKLWDCMSGTGCEVVEYEGRGAGVPVPSFTIRLIAKYDKKKLKDFLSYLQTDKRLQNFASSHEATSRGIAGYYASKRSGEYVGD